jgi:hypothetical protein
VVGNVRAIIQEHVRVSMRIEQRIIELLSKVLTGELTPEEALESWPTEEGGDERPFNREHAKFLGNAWHAIYHYSIDDDIRLKDPSYGDRQRQDITQIIVALQEMARDDSPLSEPKPAPQELT